MDSNKKALKNAAIIVGDWHFNSLGLVRSLGETGVSCYFINMSNGGYGENSRYVEKYFRAITEEEVINSIVSIAEKLKQKPVLFPSSDLAALYIDRNRDRLKKCIYPGANGNIEKIMNKTYMCQEARAAGFNTPDGETVELNEKGRIIIEKFKLPYLIKPLLSVEGKKADIIVCRTPQDVDNAITFLYSDESIYSHVLIQEFVEGKENLMVDYSGCKVHGKKVFMFGQLEKIREYPIDRGSTSFSVIKKDITFIDPETVDRFLDRVGFEGVFDLDIKVVDGNPYFIEINFRNGASSYAFTKAGFNMPLIWYQAKLGLETEKVHIDEVYMMSERDDLNNVIDRNISLFKWLKDVARTDVMMIFNRKDPQPFITAYNRFVNMVLSKIGKKLR